MQFFHFKEIPSASFPTIVLTLWLYARADNELGIAVITSERSVGFWVKALDSKAI